MRKQQPLFMQRQASRLLLALLFSAALGGCVLQPAQQGGASGVVMAGSAQRQALDENLNGFLSQASAGAIVALDQSPWGNHVEVIAEESYLAASGRECRRLRVLHSDSGQVTQALACEAAQGWEASRLVTEAHARGGRH